LSREVEAWVKTLLLGNFGALIAAVFVKSLSKQMLAISAILSILYTLKGFEIPKRYQQKAVISIRCTLGKLSGFLDKEAGY
jgi:hypothetical protein